MSPAVQHFSASIPLECAGIEGRFKERLALITKVKGKIAAVVMKLLS
jgi:hypothetical protein